MDHPRDSFQHVADCLAQGQGAALLSMIRVTGASVRDVGAHMAVSADGRMVGSLSVGCIEAALVQEAQAAIAEGAPRILHYGAGSPIIDIRLPCGGSVHVLITPVTNAAWVQSALDAWAARQRVEIALTLPDGVLFRLRHAPPLRLLVLGYGGAAAALVRLARAMAVDVMLASPDAALCKTAGVPAQPLRHPGARLDFAGDDWTAAAMLFHDHDWEAALLRQLLAEPMLMIGAMGSRRTHAARLEALTALGVDAADRARIISPLGLIHASRDPDTLALSAFVQMVDAYNRSGPTQSNA